MASNVNMDQLDSLGLTRRDPLQKKELGQEDFLKLMTTQLTNQDPFKPMENGEFLGQIAQFASVRGLETLNESFSSLKDSLYSNQAFQASVLVGRSVLLPGNVGMLTPERGTLVGAAELPEPVQDLKVRITDAVGQTVRTIPMGAQKAGSVDFVWDGKSDNGQLMPPGYYGVQASGTVSGRAVATDTMVEAYVDSVSLGGSNGSVSLNLAGLGARDFREVREIR